MAIAINDFRSSLPLVCDDLSVAHLAFRLLTVGCDRLGQLRHLVDGRSTAWCTDSADTRVRSQCAMTLQDTTTSATEARQWTAPGLQEWEGLSWHALLFSLMKCNLWRSYSLFFSALYSCNSNNFTNIILFSKLIHIQKLLGWRKK